MADVRLYDPAVRIYLAAPNHFADWKNPTSAELNANPTNDPNGTIWNITCTVDRADSTFDLGDAEVDDSLSFCQTQGTSNPTSFNPEIALSIFRSLDRWKVSDAATYNTANLAFSLLFARGVEYFAIMSVGKDNAETFAVGDRVKLARVVTPDPVDSIGSGEMARLSCDLLNRGDVNWNYEITV